ncbi:hypothetical protein [Aeromonas salmonicida]|uniref:hypothetical protein n=1 Tax=Aeromonas salmonicida TaxID=645 RepID=UPI003D209E10
MRITSLLATPGVRLLMPPAMPYRCVIFLLLLTSWGVVAASLWYGRGAMGLLHWVGVIFGGITGILVSLPRSWQRWRLAELGWDDEHLFLLNGSDDQALALPKTALVAIEREYKVGHDGQWLAFSLDLRLDGAQLAAATTLMGLGREGTHEVAPGIYRFGFKRAWHSRRAIKGVLNELLPV